MGKSSGIAASKRAWREIARDTVAGGRGSESVLTDNRDWTYLPTCTDKRNVARDVAACATDRAFPVGRDREATRSDTRPARFPPVVPVRKVATNFINS